MRLAFFCAIAPDFFLSSFFFALGEGLSATLFLSSFFFPLGERALFLPDALSCFFRLRLRLRLLLRLRPRLLLLLRPRLLLRLRPRLLRRRSSELALSESESDLLLFLDRLSALPLAFLALPSTFFSPFFPSLLPSFFLSTLPSV